MRSLVHRSSTAPLVACIATLLVNRRIRGIAISIADGGSEEPFGSFAGGSYDKKV